MPSLVDLAFDLALAPGAPLDGRELSDDEAMAGLDRIEAFARLARAGTQARELTPRMRAAIVEICRAIGGLDDSANAVVRNVIAWAVTCAESTTAITCGEATDDETAVRMVIDHTRSIAPSLADHLEKNPVGTGNALALYQSGKRMEAARDLAVVLEVRKPWADPGDVCKVLAPQVRNATKRPRPKRARKPNR